MSLFSKLKHEFVQVIPPAIFFFIAFQVIAFTQALMLRQYGITVSTFMVATIGALIVAKVVLVVDLLPFVIHLTMQAVDLEFHMGDGQLSARIPAGPLSGTSHRVFSWIGRSRPNESPPRG